MIAAEATRTSTRGRVGISTVSRVLAGTTKSANVIATMKRLIQHAESASPPPAPTPPSRRAVALPLRVGSGHPALAARLRELGIQHAEVAQAVGCSRPLVSHVLSGRMAKVRGLGTAVVHAAEVLIAQVTGAKAPGHTQMSMREELQRERAELDTLVQRAREERVQADRARRAAERMRRQLDIDQRKLAKATEIHRARSVAATLRRRLEIAGISHTRVARAARVSLSTVSHVLSGQYGSTRVVAAAEKLLAKARRSA
jgi:transcriptional regulator with XRE-family HTH domain